MQEFDTVRAQDRDLSRQDIKYIRQLINENPEIALVYVCRMI